MAEKLQHLINKDFKAKSSDSDNCTEVKHLLPNALMSCDVDRDAARVNSDQASYKPSKSATKCSPQNILQCWKRVM